MPSYTSLWLPADNTVLQPAGDVPGMRKVSSVVPAAVLEPPHASSKAAPPRVAPATMAVCARKRRRERDVLKFSVIESSFLSKGMLVRSGYSNRLPDPRH